MASMTESGVQDAGDPLEAEYLMLEPWVKKLKREDGVAVPYSPVWDVQDESKHHDAVFSLGSTSRSGVAVEPSPLTMSEIFLPDLLLDEIASLSNKYAASRLPPAQRI